MNQEDLYKSLGAMESDISSVKENIAAMKGSWKEDLREVKQLLKDHNLTIVTRLEKKDASIRDLEDKVNDNREEFVTHRTTVRNYGAFGSGLILTMVSFKDHIIGFFQYLGSGLK